MNFSQIDAERRRVGLSVLGLSRRAKVAPSTYWFIRTGKVTPKPETLKRYAAALAGKPAERATAGPAAAPGEADVAAVYQSFLIRLALKMGFDDAAVVANPGERQFWKVRALAVNATIGHTGVRGATLARALGMSKQLVSWCDRQAEDMRDDPGVEALLESTPKVFDAKIVRPNRTRRRRAA